MINTTENTQPINSNLNIFTHATKELSTDAFLTWLFYYLDSLEDKTALNIFFKTLILKNGDEHKTVSNIKIIKQAPINGKKVDLEVTFDLNGEPKTVIFENKTTSYTSYKQLKSYFRKSDYERIFLKLAYIPAFEKAYCEEFNYKVINAETLWKTLSELEISHLLINDYKAYLKFEFVNKIKEYETFSERNDFQSLFATAQGQQFFMDKLYVLLSEKFGEDLYYYCGSSSGRAWTQIRFFGENNEYVFWRIDAGSNIIRLNHYAQVKKAKNGTKEAKVARSLDLREKINLLHINHKVAIRQTAVNEISILWIELGSEDLKLEEYPDFLAETTVQIVELLREYVTHV